MTHMDRVGVRELRQNLSRYLVDVKAGESFIVTERGREVARLTPSGLADSPIARLAAERGATMPRGDLLAKVRGSDTPPAAGPPSLEVLDQLREERL
jgi:prevent-host-death family protein